MTLCNARQKIFFLLLPFLTIAILFFLSNLIMYGIYILFSKKLQIPESLLLNYPYVPETITSLILLIIFSVINRIVFRKKTIKLTTLNCKNIILSITAGAGISGLSYLWIKIAEKTPILATSLTSMDQANNNIGGNWVGTIVLAVIIAPILEEIIFRGIIFRSFEKVKSGNFAILTSAIIFGAYHMNLAQAVYATSLGVIAAILYTKTKNLLFPILIHLINNLIGAIESFISSEDIVFFINLFTVIMIIPFTYMLYQMLKNEQFSTKLINPNKKLYL